MSLLAPKTLIAGPVAVDFVVAHETRAYREPSTTAAAISIGSFRLFRVTANTGLPSSISNLVISRPTDPVAPVIRIVVFSFGAMRSFRTHALKLKDRLRAHSVKLPAGPRSTRHTKSAI